jgi:site-specific recombinase XerD
MNGVARLPHPSVGLGSAVEAFLDDRDLADTTHRVYELTLGALTKDLGAEAEVATIGRDDLRAFLRRRHGGAAPKTWNRVVATLGSFFAYCARLGWVGVSPAVGLERRRERADRSQVNRTRAIPLEELEAFLSAPHHGLRERLLWRMLYETAARAQELLLLDVEDLDLANKRAVVIGKGGNAEPIGWETATARLLPRYLAGRRYGPLFLATIAPAPARQPASADADPRTGR